jgi:hypothetical protein
MAWCRYQRIDSDQRRKKRGPCIRIGPKLKPEAIRQKAHDNPSIFVTKMPYFVKTYTRVSNQNT